MSRIKKEVRSCKIKARIPTHQAKIIGSRSRPIYKIFYRCLKPNTQPKTNSQIKAQKR
jgi:hypothetical protein